VVDDVDGRLFGRGGAPVDTDVTRTYQPIFDLFGAPGGLSIFPLNLPKMGTSSIRNSVFRGNSIMPLGVPS